MRHDAAIRHSSTGPVVLVAVVLTCAVVGLALAVPVASAAQLHYAVTLGGSGIDHVNAVVLDPASGNLFLVGETLSTDFPSTKAPIGSPAPGTLNGFVAEISADGQTLLYSVLVGGSADDRIRDAALGNNGRLYLVGSTRSPDFPVTAGALDAQCGADGTCDGGRDDAFLLSIDPLQATLVRGTFLGGSGYDWAWGLALDGRSRPYVVGATSSDDFPTAQAFQPTLTPSGSAAIPVDAFTARLNPNLSVLQYASYLGGSGEDYAYDVAVNADYEAFVTGATGSVDFPLGETTWQAGYGGGPWDAFVARIAPYGARLTFSSYLGGQDQDIARGIFVDGTSTVFVAGGTFSQDFPVRDAIQPLSNGGQDAFLTGLDLSGASEDPLLVSTYLGGSSDDEIGALDECGAGAVCVVGTTYSEDLPTVQPLQGSHAGGGSDAFFAKVEDSGRTLTLASYLGTSLGDAASAVDIDAAGTIHLGGSCEDSAGGGEGTETIGAGGGWDALAAKIVP
jgi:hypothetical protein